MQFEKILFSKELADVRDEYPKLKSDSVESSYARSSYTVLTGPFLKLLMYRKCLVQLEGCLIRLTFLSRCFSLFPCPQQSLKDISVHGDNPQHKSEVNVLG